MKLVRFATVALAAAVAFFSATQAHALALRYSGSLTVDQAAGGFSSLLGEQGAFFYEIEFGATDDDTSSIAGTIQDAVLMRGIRLGDQTFVDTVTGALDINFNSSDGFNFATTAQSTSSADFSNVTFGIIAEFDPELFRLNPLLESQGGQFGLLYDLLFQSTTPTLPGSSVSVVGLDDPLSGLFRAVGTIDSVTLATGSPDFDPVLNPDPDPDPDPDPGNGGQQPPVTTVPVPAALPLLATALGWIFLIRRRRTA